MKKKIYISGPMTGVEDLNKPLFDEAAERLRSLGWEVFNPHDIHLSEEFEDAPSWLDYILADLSAMKDCSAVCLLNGWEKSYGARVETLVAQKLGMTTYAYDIHFAYDPRCTQQHWDLSVNNGGATWADVPDAEEWVRCIRGDMP